MPYSTHTRTTQCTCPPRAVTDDARLHPTHAQRPRALVAAARTRPSAWPRSRPAPLSLAEGRLSRRPADFPTLAADFDAPSRRAVNRRAAAGARRAARRRRARLLGRHRAHHPARGGRERAVDMGTRDAEAQQQQLWLGRRGARRRARARQGGGAAPRGAGRKSADDGRRDGRRVGGGVGVDGQPTGRNSHLRRQSGERRGWSVLRSREDEDATERKRAVRCVCARARGVRS